MATCSYPSGQYVFIQPTLPYVVPQTIVDPSCARSSLSVPISVNGRTKYCVGCRLTIMYGEEYYVMKKGAVYVHTACKTEPPPLDSTQLSLKQSDQTEIRQTDSGASNSSSECGLLQIDRKYKQLLKKLEEAEKAKKLATEQLTRAKKSGLATEVKIGAMKLRLFELTMKRETALKRRECQTEKQSEREEWNKRVQRNRELKSKLVILKQKEDELECREQKMFMELSKNAH